MNSPDGDTVRLRLTEHCLVIAEVAQAHDGSLGAAHAFIDAAAEAGADAVKFQTHIAAAESTPEEPWRIRFSPQDETRFEYWQRMEFTPDQWAGLKEHADRRGLVFLSTPFSPEAVELLRRVGVTGWKIASGEVGNPLLLRPIRDTGLPVLLSSGMSPWAELDRAVAFFREAGVETAVLQCTSRYPTPPEHVGLNIMLQMRERYGLPVGLSDHSGTIFPGLAAAVHGAAVIEVHLTFHKAMFGPDVPASLTPEQLAELVRGVRFIEAMNAAPVDKDRQAEELAEMRRLFTKSLVWANDLPEGTVVAEQHFAARKPGTGISVERLPDLLGRRLQQPVTAGAWVAADDFRPPSVPSTDTAADR